jgi:hypothetical protein
MEAALREARSLVFSGFHPFLWVSRHGTVRRWAFKLYAVEKTEAGAIGTLLDIVALTTAPAAHDATWSPLSAIDAMVSTYVALAEPKPEPARPGTMEAGDGPA